MKWLIFISILLYGCGGEVHLTPLSGLWYQNDGGTEIKFSVIAESYTRVQECTGLSAIGPHVKTVKFLPNDDVGHYDADTSLVSITKPESYILEHEFIHHLLFNNTGDVDNCHNSELFSECSGATFKEC